MSQADPSCSGRFPDRDDDAYFRQLSRQSTTGPQSFRNATFPSGANNFFEKTTGTIFFPQEPSVNDFISTTKNDVIGHYGDNWWMNDGTSNTPYKWLSSVVGDGTFTGTQPNGPGFRPLNDALRDGAALTNYATQKAAVDILATRWSNGGSTGVVFWNDNGCGDYGQLGQVSPADPGQSYHSGSFEVTNNQISLASIGEQMRDELQIGFTKAYISPGMKLSITYGNHRVISTPYQTATNAPTKQYNDIKDYMCFGGFDEKFLDENGQEFDGWTFEVEATTTGKFIDFGALMSLYHQYDVIGSAHWENISFANEFVGLFGANSDSYVWVAFTPTVCCKPKLPFYQISKLTISRKIPYDNLMFRVCQPFSTGLRMSKEYEKNADWKASDFNCDAVMSRACSFSTDPVCDCFKEQRELDVQYNDFQYPVLAPCMGARCGAASVYKTAQMIQQQANCNNLCVQLIEQSGKDIIQESDQLAACGGATYTADGTVGNIGVGEQTHFDPITTERLNISTYIFIGTGALLILVLIIGLVLWIIRSTTSKKT